MPLGWCYITLFDSDTSVAASLFCPNLLHQSPFSGRTRQWFIQQEFRQEFSLWDWKQKAVGRAGVKHDSSWSVETGYLGSYLFRFTWETQCTFAAKTGAVASQQHPHFCGLPLGLRKAGLGMRPCCHCWAVFWLRLSWAVIPLLFCTSSEGWWPNSHQLTPICAQAAVFSPSP